MHPSYIVAAGLLTGIIVYILTKWLPVIGLGIMWGGIIAYIYAKKGGYS